MRSRIFVAGFVFASSLATAAAAQRMQATSEATADNAVYVEGGGAARRGTSWSSARAQPHTTA